MVVGGRSPYPRPGPFLRVPPPRVQGQRRVAVIHPTAQVPEAATSRLAGSANYPTFRAVGVSGRMDPGLGGGGIEVGSEGGCRIGGEPGSRGLQRRGCRAGCPHPGGHSAWQAADLCPTLHPPLGSAHLRPGPRGDPAPLLQGARGARGPRPGDAPAPPRRPTGRRRGEAAGPSSAIAVVTPRHPRTPPACPSPQRSGALITAN